MYDVIGQRAKTFSCLLYTSSLARLFLRRNEILQVRREKLDKLQQEGKDPFQITKFPVDQYAAAIKEAFAGIAPEEETGKTVCLGGRLMSKRVMGKASFADLRDASGAVSYTHLSIRALSNVQSAEYIPKDVGLEQYKDCLLYTSGQRGRIGEPVFGGLEPRRTGCAGSLPGGGQALPGRIHPVLQ